MSQSGCLMRLMPNDKNNQFELTVIRYKRATDEKKNNVFPALHDGDPLYVFPSITI